MSTADDYRDALLSLADELDDLAEMPADQVVVTLARLTNRASPDSAEGRLRGIRALAARAVVERFGGLEIRGAQAKAAKALGVTEQTLSRMLSGLD